MRLPPCSTLALVAAGLFVSSPAFAALNFASSPGLGSAPYVNADIDTKIPAATDNLLDAMKNTKPFLEERYRYEAVSQKGLQHTIATANTLRSIFGFQTGNYKDFQIALAGENELQIGAQNYSDGLNDRSSTKWPRIGDPHDNNLQLANIAWYGLPNTTIVAGRQYLVIDNQRFIGTSNWRQNRQNFDAVTVKHALAPDVEVLYSYIFDVNRSPGSRSNVGTYQMNTHAMHVAYTGIKDAKLSAYAYLANIDHQPTLSSATSGLRGEYQHAFNDAWKVTGVAEYARQTDYANSAHGFAVNYYEMEPGLVWSPSKTFSLNPKLGYEILGSDGQTAMQTPMASLHTQNGWADQFGTTPTQGLKDFVASATARYQLPFDTVGPTKLQVDWHNFHASDSDAHYGNELDVSVAQPFLKYFTAEFQFADYHADALLADTKKFMGVLTFQY